MLPETQHRFSRFSRKQNVSPDNVFLCVFHRTPRRHIYLWHKEKKGSKRFYAIRALKKCGLTDRQLILVYCSVIRSVLEYASPAWAGLTQYLNDQIESIQKRALKIIFPSLCYEDALKKSGLILLRQRREDACITFLKLLFFRPATKLSAASCAHKTVCP